jgi:hypothetical protein
MWAGVVKATPFAGLLGALSVRNLALYATTVTLLAGLLVIGAVWAAAKAWRERAEARSDEATQLSAELAEEREQKQAQKAENQKLHERVLALEKSRDFVAAFEPLTRAIDQVRADSTHEHEKLQAALEEVVGALGEIAKGLAANTGVTGALAAGIHAGSAD